MKTFDPIASSAVIVGAVSQALDMRESTEANVEEGTSRAVAGHGVGTRHAVLALGYLALLSVGLLNLFEGDLTGAAFILLGGFGLVRLRSRLAGLLVWVTAGLLGLAGIAGGDLRGLLLAAVGVAGAIAAAWPDELAAAFPPTAAGSAPVDELDPEPAEPEPILRIRTVGRLTLEAAGNDLTAGLLERRVLAFIWFYLLTQKAAGPDGRVARSVLGQEVSPVLDASTQRQRLRGQIRDLQKLDSPLAERLRVDGELVGLDLDSCSFDVLHLRDLVAEVRTTTVLSRRQQRRVAGLLAELGSGLYLPGWEEIEHRATGGRGDAGQLVASVRAHVSALRADLALALGQSYLSGGQPTDAIQFLEDALSAAPFREDVARLLVAACLRTGKNARAEELEADYALREKV